MKTCKNCGLLALRERDIGRLVEVSQYLRENPATFGFSGIPECFVEAFSLGSEIEQLWRAEKTDSIKRVIEKDRSDCPKWIKWNTGLSPKEHLGMADAEKERHREDGKWRWGVLRIGLALVFATLLGPILAVVVNNCVFGNN